ncbi:MAG: transcription termination/antitermination protein NusA [Anaerolineales bacterium]|nr:transcription termination/antitermination protein NusA [Anaerolineales bacterium]
MKSEFELAFNEVLEDRQLSKEVVLEALEAAMVSAYRRAVNASNAQHVEASIDLETGHVAIFAEKEVVENIQDERTEVLLDEALKVDANTSAGEMVIVETTPKNFGRVAAQTARQVIQQRIREAERDAQVNHFGQQLGEIVSGVVQAVNSQAVTLGLDMKAEGIMPRNQQIPGERFRMHDRIRALLLEVKASTRGPQIILSRAHRNFLRRLLENEVPEIYHGLVEIRSIAREPGHRSKVAVAGLQPGVDPVGACVGIRGVRIQAIVRELSDEKIDVIEWNNDPVVYIAKALSPARVTGVYLDDYTKGAKTATVVVPEDQLSLSIGRDGQNARLAAKLTSWRIDIKSLPEAAVDAIYKLQNQPEFAKLAQQEAEIVPQVELILAKKAERRPVTPEEYKVLSKFVDRVEQGLIQQLKKEREAEEEERRIVQASIPEAAYDLPIEESGISLRFCNILGGAGFTTIGDLMLQMELNRDVILALEGIGPKAMEEVDEILSNITFPEPEEEIEPEPEAVEVEKVEALEETEIEPEAVTEEPILAKVKADTEEEEVEPVEEPIVEVSTVETDIAAEKVEDVSEEEESASFDELFALEPGDFEMVEPLDDDEEDDDVEKAKKKKKKKKYVEMEYDPDKDVVVVKKKRKRAGSEDWDDNWDI